MTKVKDRKNYDFFKSSMKKKILLTENAVTSQQTLFVQTELKKVVGNGL